MDAVSSGSVCTSTPSLERRPRAVGGTRRMVCLHAGGGATRVDGSAAAPCSESDSKSASDDSESLVSTSSHSGSA